MTTNSSTWITALVTALLAILFGVGWFFMVIIMLNGFTTAEGTPLLLTALAFIVVNVGLSAWLSQWLAGLIQRRMAWSPWLTGSVGVVAATILGAMFVMLCSIASIVVMAPR